MLRIDTFYLNLAEDQMEFYAMTGNEYTLIYVFSLISKAEATCDELDDPELMEEIETYRDFLKEYLYKKMR